jgi:ParB family transcriptional regulator, chromosome partitioning protein
MRTELIPIDSIRVMLSRSRPKEGWEQIKATMADPKVGLQMPVSVRELEKPDGKIRYELLYGEGRLTAARALKWKEIPAIVRKVSNTQAVSLFLGENLDVRRLSWMEKGRIIRDELADGASIEDVAQVLHISEELARKYHRVVSKVAAGEEKAVSQLPVNDAEVLTTLPAEGQRIVLKLSKETGEQVRNVVKKAKRAVEGGAQWTKASLMAALRHYEQEGQKIDQRLRMLRLHRALGPGNIRRLLEDKAIRTAAAKAGLPVEKFTES